MQDQKEPVKKHDLLNAAVMAIVLAVGTADIVRYIMLGEPVSLVTICVIEILFTAFSYTAWKTGLSLLFLPAAIGGFVLFFNMTHFETTMFNSGLLVQAIASAVGAVFGTAGQIRKKYPLRRPSWPAVIAGVLTAVLALGAWCGNALSAKGVENVARRSV